MKRYLSATLSIALLLIAAQASAEDVETEPEVATEKTKKALVEEPLEEAEEVEEALKEALEEIPQWKRQKRDPKHAKKLDEIVLPKNPTREQCKAYLKELDALVQNKRMFSDDDEEVEKLKAIPAEHIDLVFGLLDSGFGLDFYAECAIDEIDPKTIRKTIVKHLDENPANISIIVMYGWVQDAKPVIMNKLKTAEGDSSPAWYQAFVELAEPKHYARLHDIAVGSRHAADYIELLKTLPDYDLTATIDACWEKRSTGRDFHDFDPFYSHHDPETQLAVHAAAIGKTDALAFLIDRLQNTGPNRFGGNREDINQTRLGVTRFIPFRGTNEEIKDWYKANKDQLIFDEFQKRYVVEEDF